MLMCLVTSTSLAHTESIKQFSCNFRQGLQCDLGAINAVVLISRCTMYAMCYVRVVAFVFSRRYLYVRVLPAAIYNKLLIVFGSSGI